MFGIGEHFNFGLVQDITMIQMSLFFF